MTLEQQLRENLKVVADALILPEPRSAPPSIPPRAWARGFGLALAGAAAVVVLAVPALFIWQGDELTGGGGLPTTVAPTVPTTVPTTVATMPSTTTTQDTSQPSNSDVFLGAYMAGDHEFALFAEKAGDEEPIPATVYLYVFPVGSSEATQSVVVGGEGGFFWHTLQGPDPVCHFLAEAGGGGIDVTVEIRLSPSLGCSDSYLFELSSGELAPREKTPQDIARRFLTAWQEGDEDVIARLGEPQARSAAQDIDAPVDPEFERCEGAAGTVYCTWEDGGDRIVIRVRTQPPAMVIEVRTEPTN